MPRCPLPRCPPLLFGAALSSLVLSGLAISASPIILASVNVFVDHCCVNINVYVLLRSITRKPIVTQREALDSVSLAVQASSCSFHCIAMTMTMSFISDLRPATFEQKNTE